MITIICALSVLLTILLPLLTSRYFLKYISIDCLITFCMAVMIRALFPVEFSFSTTIPDSKVSPAIRDVMLFPVSVAGRSVYFCHILFFVWLCIACFLILKKLLLCCRMQKLIRRLPDCEDRIVREVWRTILSKYPSASGVRVIRTKLKISPQVMGVRYPVILLPEYPFSRSEYEMILEHETLHCLQHDILLKMVIDLLCTFYWWNPVFYILKKRMFDLIEIRNDRRMTLSLSSDEKAVYMQCLTDTVRKIQASPAPLALPLGHTSQRALRKRMYVIGYSRLTSRIRQTAVFLLLLLSLWLASSFTLEPYSPLGAPYIVLNGENTFLLQDGSQYEVYYQGAFLYTVDSVNYFSKDIPIYTKSSD